MKRLSAASSRLPKKKKKQEEETEAPNALDQAAVEALLAEVHDAEEHAKEDGIGVTAFQSTFKSRKLRPDGRFSKNVVNRTEKTNAYIERKANKAREDNTNTGSEATKKQGSKRASGGGSTEENGELFVFSPMDTYFE